MIMMNRNRNFIWAPLLAVCLGLLGGCTGSSTVEKVDLSGKKADSSTTGAADKATGETKAGTAPATQPDATATAEVPPEFRTDAFEYYGLGNKGIMNLEMKAPEAGVTTGSQEFRQLRVTGDGVIFAINRTGNLGGMTGANEVIAKRDGIYVISSSMAKVTEPQLELPADLSPGKTWSTTVEVDQPSNQMKLTTTNRVVRTESVTTPVGTYPDALLVTSEGQGVMNGSNVKLSQRAWFVRGRGSVKSEISVTQGTSTRKLTVSEAK